ncbi:DNA-binding protein [Polaribacter reichenbachii]|uniref:DNA-binding protein n=1 Tax=Polaribacter reichenbachii TaxID=996801 RepID=A0A1B8TPY6_9FLAO|nr:NAD(P)/FAD-dependent oxidoreductase [Polaribacter reichenbachii]APZ46765.1 DNA-binding protein [Polaribacter reichenbachii]AUC17408.1 DNA-binding protein [Polaribacter reichenbachii]OBY61717.1 DNA-binding protein [Polaribacter reichenbachii]
MEKFDVVIVGAGTAGIILARELGKFKKKTLVLDRKKDLLEFSFNTLGSFIDLDKFGLTTNVVAQDIHTVCFHSNSVKRNLKTNLYVLDKKKVHEEIINSVDKNYVTFLTGVNIKNINKGENGNFLSVVDKDKNEYLGTVFVDASGTNGIISKKVGLIAKKTLLATGVEYNVAYKGDKTELHLLMGKDYQGGYGWIFPLKNKRAIIGFGTCDDDIVKDLKNRLHRILELPKIKKLVQKDNDNVEGGSIPITPVLDKFVVNNLICVGDCVSQVNPIVGEGYKFIFEAAIMASKAINKSIEENNIDILKDYETTWKNRFLLNYQRSKRAQERFFKYSKNNLLMDYTLFISKFISDERCVRSLSGEYGLENEV